MITNIDILLEIKEQLIKIIKLLQKQETTKLATSTPKGKKNVKI